MTREQRPPDDIKADPIATWREGEVTAATFSSWLRFTRQDPDLSLRQSRIERMLLTQVLAQLAVNSGANTDPRVQSELARDEDRRLVKLFRAQTNEQIEISDAEINNYFERYPDVLLRPRKIRLSNLFLRYPMDASAEQRDATRNRMLELRHEIEQGADFADVAKKESDSQTRFRDGLMGNVAITSLPPHLVPVIEDLKVGAMSKIVETPDGITTLKCEGYVDAYRPSMETRRKDIVPHLRRIRLKEEWTRLRDKLLTDAQLQTTLRAQGGKADSDDIVAEFNGGVLTRADLHALVRQLPGVVDISKLSDEKLTTIVEDRVFEILTAMHARKLGLHRNSVFEEEQRWQRLLILASHAVEKYINAELAPIEEQQVRQYFNAHPEEFMRRPHFKLALIRLDLTPGQEQKVYRKAVQLQSALASEETKFAAAAKKHSEHPSAPDGGDLGMLSQRQLAGFGSEVFRTVKSLTIGEISELVQHQQSLYIIRLDGYEPKRPLTWEEAADRAEKLLGTHQSQRLQEALENGLLSDLSLEVRQ
ncbi:MAG: hypothetical protein GY906_02080 [bacterium]|nr:hypothetical protein [bacterium]